MRESTRLTKIAYGDFFTFPGNETVWQKLKEKPENRGGNWMYWCTDGSVKKLLSCRRTVFTRHKLKEHK